MKTLMQTVEKVTLVVTLFLLFFAFSCQQRVEQPITEEQAKAMAERSAEIWNEGNLALVDELYAPEVVYHEVDISEDRVGVEALKEWVNDSRSAFPDFNVTFEEIFAKDDKVVTRWTVTGTNTDPMDDRPATCKTVRFSGVNIARVVNGKIAEEWLFYNNAALLEQLGFTLTPPQGQS